MQDKLKLYEDISENMIIALKNEDYDLLDSNIEKRQAIIDYILEEKLADEFRELYNKKEIFKLDILVKEMLGLRLNDTKKEIREYKFKIQGNNIYSSVKKENFNIFYKEV